MNKLYLIKNPEIFQGEKYLETNKTYFEGWYFKNTNKENGISVIPGININENERKSFIQVITNKESYYVNYNIDEFEFSDKPFCIKIGKNLFSKPQFTSLKMMLLILLILLSYKYKTLIVENKSI